MPQVDLCRACALLQVSFRQRRPPRVRFQTDSVRGVSALNYVETHDLEQCFSTGEPTTLLSETREFLANFPSVKMEAAPAFGMLI